MGLSTTRDSHLQEFPGLHLDLLLENNQGCDNVCAVCLDDKRDLTLGDVKNNLYSTEAEQTHLFDFLEPVPH